MLAQGTPTLGIVGAGRVGRALGRRLHELGWRVGPVVTRKKSSARMAVKVIGEGRAHAGLTRQILAADVLLIATPDDVLSKVAAEMAEMGREEWRGKIVLHTSGAICFVGAREAEATRRGNWLVASAADLQRPRDSASRRNFFRHGRKPGRHANGAKDLPRVWRHSGQSEGPWQGRLPRSGGLRRRIFPRFDRSCYAHSDGGRIHAPTGYARA